MMYYERIIGEILDVLNNYQECSQEEKIRILKDLLEMFEEQSTSS